MPYPREASSVPLFPLILRNGETEQRQPSSSGWAMGLAGVLGLPIDEKLGLGNPSDMEVLGSPSEVDGLPMIRDLSSPEGIGGISFSLPFPLPLRLNKAFNAPLLFFSDRPDDFRFSSGVFTGVATPSER